MSDEAYAAVIFTLPDGRIVLQRRTLDAPYAAGLLGLFGGAVEPGETDDEAIRREIGEETSFDPDALDLVESGEFAVRHGVDQRGTRRYHVWRCRIPDLEFDVFEGDGAEAYPLAELGARPDVAPAARWALGLSPLP